VVLTGFQAWLGKITVDTNNAGEWVTAHLAAALLLLALLTYIVVRSRTRRSCLSARAEPAADPLLPPSPPPRSTP
jgi:heme A synthase